jgi:hypothetical protein
MTSKGIYKIKSWNDLELLRAGCSCGNAEHDHNIQLSVEDDPYGLINVSIESNLKYCDISVEWNGNLFKKAWSRIKTAFKILWTGELVIMSEFIFEDEEQVRDYIQAINDAILRLRINGNKRTTVSPLPETTWSDEN